MKNKLLSLIVILISIAAFAEESIPIQISGSIEKDVKAKVSCKCTFYSEELCAVPVESGKCSDSNYTFDTLGLEPSKYEGSSCIGYPYRHGNNTIEGTLKKCRFEIR